LDTTQPDNPAGLRFPIEGYPALYRAADAASVSGRRAYLRLVWAELLLVVLGAAFGSIAAFEPSVAGALPLLAAASFFAAPVLKIVTRDRRYDRQWFDGRAVGEATRATAWRYMMRVPPFDGDAADAKVADELRTVLQARPNVTPALAAGPERIVQITPEMRDVRARPIAARRDLYRSARIGEQIDWYRSRAVAYGRRSAQLFWLGVTAQLTAFGVVALGLAIPVIARFNVLGLLGTVAIAATVISQVNRHDELSKRYGFAMQELSFADTNAASAASEPALAAAVADAEGVIAREHGLWLAGR
jgi:hypothetical protein